MVLRDGKRYGKERLEAIDAATPALEKRLKRVRADYETSFWKKSGLDKVRKADNAEAALTPAESAEVREAVANMDAGGYSSVLYDEMSAMVVSGYTSARELLDLSLNFGDSGAASYAMEALREHVDKFSTLIDQREQQTLNEIIDDSLASGDTPKVLASRIAQAFEDGYHINGKDEDGNIVLVRTETKDAWTKMVARTELSRAQSLGNMALYQDAGIQKVMWMASGGENMCDLCAPADGQVVDMGDAFPDVDVSQPPAHPNCVCVVVAADEDVNRG